MRGCFSICFDSYLFKFMNNFKFMEEHESNNELNTQAAEQLLTFRKLNSNEKHLKIYEVQQVQKHCQRYFLLNV